MPKSGGVRVEKGTATGTFTLSSWDEDTYETLDSGGKLTRATVKQTFNGDLQGEGSVVWLMCYSPDGTASFVGLQRINGSIAGRKGSVVLETSGEFDGELARGRWHVVEGSGSEELSQLNGEGGFEAPHGSEAAVTLTFRLG
jgi:Protein of unknown function (DUF3224)